MFGWFSTISRALSSPVGYLDRILETRKPAAAQSSDSPAEQQSASAQRSAFGPGKDPVAEWQKGATRPMVAEWQKGTDRQTVPEWKTDLWKHRVEGEARRRFNGEIAGVGGASQHHF